MKKKADCMSLLSQMQRLTGFFHRKQYPTIYIMGYLEFYTDLMENLGKFRNGKGCLCLIKLEDIDLEVLGPLITTSIKRLKSQ